MLVTFWKDSILSDN